jgi:mannose-1-phosphate guanylyltransferase
MRVPKALVFAAGHGTRLRPLTDVRPKCLVPIAGRPLLEYWLVALADAGVREVWINTHHLRDQVQAFIRDVNGRGAQLVTELFEPHLLGSAGTVAANGELAGEADLFLVYADNYSAVDLSAMLAYHRRHGDPLTMMLFRAPNPRDCGIAQLDLEGRVVEFEEKPAHPRGNLANAGVYVVSAAAYREIAGARAADLGRDVLPRFVGRMRGWTFDGCHIDIGTPEGYARAAAEAGQVNAVRGIGDSGLRAAVFLNRDGVLAERENAGQASDEASPARGAAPAIVALRRAGYACVLLVPEATSTIGDRSAPHERLCERFAAEGAIFDGVYRRRGASSSAETAQGGPGHEADAGLRCLAADLKIDLARSWFIDAPVGATSTGSSASDRDGITVMRASTGADVPSSPEWRCRTTPDLQRAVGLVLNSSATGRQALA